MVVTSWYGGIRYNAQWRLSHQLELPVLHWSITNAMILKTNKKQYLISALCSYEHYVNFTLNSGEYAKVRHSNLSKICQQVHLIYTHMSPKFRED